MTPYGYGPTGWGSPAPGFGFGMGNQNMFQSGFGPFPAGNWTPSFGGGMGYGAGFQPGFGPNYGPSFADYQSFVGGMMPGPMQMGWGLGGVRRWGGTYSPQFRSTGLPTDDETVEMTYDAIDNDPLIPYDADINVDCDAGTVTLTGTVSSKQIKHAAGDDAWWIPGVDDVHNDLSVEIRHPAHSAQPQRQLGGPRRMSRSGTTSSE